MGLFDFFKKKETPLPRPTRSEWLEPVTVAPGLALPKAIAQHWASIESARLPSIAITATASDNLALEDSKLGHYPCMPLGFEYPKDAEGKYMYPLAQINCKDLAGLPGYPQAGYLQFYIAAYDDMYGLDFDNPQEQKNFRVLYFAETVTEPYKVDFSFLDAVMRADMLPVEKPHALQFTLTEQYPSPQDARVNESRLFDKILAAHPAINDELFSAAYDAFLLPGHRVGGYPHFTQEDPRVYNDACKDYILLLQIDTDDCIMWGDSGVANFFIHPDDLARNDFSKVLYNWDCC
jgi:uncharacterized protein YwqG